MSDWKPISKRKIGLTFVESSRVLSAEMKRESVDDLDLEVVSIRINFVDKPSVCVHSSSFELAVKRGKSIFPAFCGPSPTVKKT